MTTTLSEIDLLKQKNEILEALVKSLQEQIDWLKKQLFGRKSERFISNEAEQFLPGLEPIEPEDEEEKIFVATHEKRKAKSTPINTITFPDDLPVETQIIDLPEDQKVDPVTGLALVCIGEESSRKLAMKASSYFIKEIIRKKYAMPGIPDEGIKTPEIPDSVIFRCSVDESVLADIITKKFCDHLPIYRQSEMMTRSQIYISKQTLSSYVLKIGQALKPLYALLEEEIKKSGNIFVDETPVDILAPGTGKTKQGYMTVMAGGKSVDPPLRIYRFFTDRKHQTFTDFLEGYKGVFHSDKYGAYEKEAKDKDKTWSPCWSHIRRKFVEAESGDPKFREEVLLDIQRIFEIEQKCKTETPEERVRVRELEALPIIDGLVKKVKAILTTRILPKSKLSGAIGYFMGLVPYLKNYIANPWARPDNNVAERALKLVVIGRKNWLFVGNEGGGEASAVIYSLSQTCRALKINPSLYFEDVLRRIQSHPYKKLHELLPQNWAPIN